MRPEASVIIPTRNRRAMVGEAVASVLSQQDASFELIVYEHAERDYLELIEELESARASRRVLGVEPPHPSMVGPRLAALRR